MKQKKYSPTQKRMNHLSRHIVTNRVTYIVTLYSNYIVSLNRVSIKVTVPESIRISNYFG